MIQEFSRKSSQIISTENEFIATTTKIFFPPPLRLPYPCVCYFLTPEEGHPETQVLSVVVTQSCLTLCDPLGWCPPDSSVHEIFQARILEWVAIPFSRGPSDPWIEPQVSCIAGRFFTICATREAHRPW